MNNSRSNMWPIPVVALLLAASAASYAQPGVDSSKLTVEETAGPVKVRTSARWRTPMNGMVMGMPSTASTGVEGNIKVRQQATVISVAANTAVEFLDGNVPGAPIQRVIQERGSAFYDIAPRGDNKLRVEAAYLAAVVKGTQFHVIVEEDSTTISLFEGHLQIEAPGVGDNVDIYAGQIARIHRDDPRISVINMENGELVARNDTGGTASGTVGELIADAGDLSADAGVSVGLGGLDAAVSGGADAGLAGVSGDITAGVDVAGGEVNAKAGVNVDLGNGVLGAGVQANAALGTGEVGLGVDVEAGGALDAGVDANADVGAGTVDLGVDASGPLDVGADASADVGAGDVDLGVDAGAPLDVGVDASADVGTGDVDLGVEAGSLDVDASLDLGVADDLGETLAGEVGGLLDETTSEPDPADDGTADPLPDLGNLIGL